MKTTTKKTKTVRKVGRPIEIDYLKIKMLRDKGLTIVQVAKKMKISTTAVWYGQSRA